MRYGQRICILTDLRQTEPGGRGGTGPSNSTDVTKAGISRHGKNNSSDRLLSELRSDARCYLGQRSV
jgi:hypothetical protein